MNKSCTGNNYNSNTTTSNATFTDHLPTILYKPTSTCTGLQSRHDTLSESFLLMITFAVNDGELKMF